MSTNVECASVNDTLVDAARKMRDLNVGALPICGDDNKLKGMLTDRDITVRAVAEGRDPSSVQVSEFADQKPVTIGADDSLEEALRTMTEHDVRRLPVIDGHDLVGMVSQATSRRTCRESRPVRSWRTSPPRPPTTDQHDLVPRPGQSAPCRPSGPSAHPGADTGARMTPRRIASADRAGTPLRELPMSERDRLVVWVAILASFVAFLDGSIVNVALPAVRDDLGGGLAIQQWVLDAYLLALGALILTAGAISDTYGRVRVLRWGLLAFGAASLACALAPSARC
jgi:predicted transcriptional regulator